MLGVDRTLIWVTCAVFVGLVLAIGWYHDYIDRKVRDW